MSNIDKKTLAGLLVGIGAFALAAKRGNAKSGSSSWFPQPTGKVTKGADEFTREQDEVYFSFRQNAPTKSISDKFGPDLDSRYQNKRSSSSAMRQIDSKRASLQELRKSLSQNTFGDETAVANMQNELNSIQAQIDNASVIMEGLEATLKNPMLSADLVDDYTNDFNQAKAQLESAQQRLGNVVRVMPQSQKARIQAQVSSLSAGIIALNKQVDRLDADVTSIQQNIRTSGATSDDYTIQEYFNEFTERGWDADSKARYGTEADAKFDAWKASVDGFGNPDSVIGKFDGTSDASDNLSGIGFKDGIKDVKMDDKRFSGESSSNPFASSFTLPTLK